MKELRLREILHKPLSIRLLVKTVHEVLEFDV
jgi:hypothetical protein